MVKCHAKPQRGDINIRTYYILMEWTGTDILGGTILLFITEPPSVRHEQTPTRTLTSRCACMPVCVCSSILCHGVYLREMMDRCQWQVFLSLSLPLCVCARAATCVIDGCRSRGLSVFVQTPLNTCSLA